MRASKESGARKRSARIVILMLVGAVAQGCGGGISPTGGDADFQTRRTMSALASFYGDYLSAYGAPPKDEASFRTFLAEDSARIERMDIGGIDGLLKSPRDGQPLVVVYGTKITPAGAPNSPWVAHEQTGVDGKQMAAKVRGEVEELTAADIAKQFTVQSKK
jgi:hypothetical protein